MLPNAICYSYIPFSGGPRKCVGDQFAIMEAVVALAVLLKRFDFELVPGQTINMTTGVDSKCIPTATAAHAAAE